MIKEATPNVYLVFLANQPAQRLFSTVDLIGLYTSQMKKRSETNEWWRPIEFIDDDGSKNIIAAYSPYAIQAIVMGVITPNIPEAISTKGT